MYALRAKVACLTVFTSSPSNLSIVSTASITGAGTSLRGTPDLSLLSRLSGVIRSLFVASRSAKRAAGSWTAS